MDLHFTAGPPTQVERDALDGVAPDEVAGRRDLLLPALHAVADAVGWISPEAIDEIGRRLHVAPAEVYGVASF
jgi:NADH-quinone oxidoreductase subunit F